MTVAAGETAKTIEVTEQNFNDITPKGIVLLDWWATWCGPCRTFAPTFEAAAGRHPDVTFGKIDTDAQPALSAAFEIRSIPTLMVLRDGVLLFAQPGALPAAALDEIIGKVKALDMDDVRKQIAEAEAAEMNGEAPANAEPTKA
jgi:thioredoxin 1